MGMKCKGRNDVIGIRVAPRVGHCRIIDGQDLDDLHARGHGPVDQTAQVAEVAHPVRVLTAEREDGYHHSGSTPHPLLYTKSTTMNNKDRTIRNHRLVWRQQALSSAIVALLPSHKRIRLIINDDIFIFNGHKHGIHID